MSAEHRETPIHGSAKELASHLQRLKELRGAQAKRPARLAELKLFQSRRLAQTYQGLAAQPRYQVATAFFLDDLYGPKDFSARDQEMVRIVPVMSRILPASAVETAALAIELEALSEELDHKTALQLPAGPIVEATYAEAYRKATTRVERERQIALIVAVGRRLDRLVKTPFVFRTLRLMRQPAKLAGLEDLQEFLEHGFKAFRDMDGAEEFLALIDERETSLRNRLFSGAPRPFSTRPPA